MHFKQQYSCPACASTAIPLLKWKFSGLGQSVFNYTADFHCCNFCGHLFVANIDDERLQGFYADECSYFANEHFATESPENICKYEAYREMLAVAGLESTSLADIGCGRGGFITWLKNTGWEGECCGVDPDGRSMPAEVLWLKGLRFFQGVAPQLPFASDSQCLLTYFHVLEHIHALDRLLNEAARVLTCDGHLLIEVPDASRYGDYPIGTAFWLSIREHVAHFTPKSIVSALARHGFMTLSVKCQVLPTPEFSYPSLMVLARRSSVNVPIDPSPTPGNICGLEAFALASKACLDKQATWIEQLIKKHGRVIFWGLSAELFSLLPLINVDKVSLCDSSPLKQTSQYRGLRILAPTEISKNDGAMVIAPYLHREKIRMAASQLGWFEELIYSLE